MCVCVCVLASSQKPLYLLGYVLALISAQNIYISDKYHELPRNRSLKLQQSNGLYTTDHLLPGTGEVFCSFSLIFNQTFFQKVYSGLIWFKQFSEVQTVSQKPMTIFALHQKT